MCSFNPGYFSRSHGHAASDNERRLCFMRWLWKLLKGSGFGVSNGCHPIIGEGNLLHRPIKPEDDRSNTRNEDLDHVLSLAVDARKNKDARYKGRRDHNDRQASATGESSRFSSLPYYPAKTLPLPTGYRTCGRCCLEIGYGHYLSSNGKFWHPQCFRCYACHQLIYETERWLWFCLSGSDPYHKSCCKEFLHHPKCDVCHEFIPTNGAGLIEYRAHPFWGQKYCPSHEHDLTRRCCGCERMEVKKYKIYMSLGDGRNLCMECLDSAIMDSGECQDLYHSIRDYYEGMNMKIHQQISVLLVERQALNEAKEGEKDGHHHMPETRGLCLSEEQTVSSILKRPRIGGNRFLDVRTYPQKLTRKCEVTAILVLYGLPRLLTGSILAHELMHGWLRLSGKILMATCRDIVIEYSNNMKKLAETLLCMISQSLDLPPSYIQDAVGEVYQNITFSYYPPCPQPELALGLQSHSDMGAITLLMQDDVGGLEVLKDGHWIEVKPLSDAIVVILADQTEVITNGKYKSAVHRAIVNNRRPRFSVATFYDPSKTKKISPAPQLVSKKSPLKFREVLYGDYVSSWYSKGPEGKRNIDDLLIE